MIWLLPYFFTAVCLGDEGMILPPRDFGPFDSLESAQRAAYFVRNFYPCETKEPERKWRWTTATTIKLNF